MEYEGYSLQRSVESPVAVIEDIPSPEEFFKTYIGPRRPCVLQIPPNGPRILRRDLEKAAGDQAVQVEKRHSLFETFGQLRTPSRQIEMTLSRFLSQICDGGSATKCPSEDEEMLYLTTQQESDSSPYKVPCRQLLQQNIISSSPPFGLSANLDLYSCNLWLGKCTTLASSGLHHDYHDNFYLLLNGRKRFRLFSPDCAFQLYTYGKVKNVLPNGQIIYVDENDETEEFVSGDDDEEEIVLGRGYDYKTDSENDDSSFPDFDSDKDDFDEIMIKDVDKNHDHQNVHEHEFKEEVVSSSESDKTIGSIGCKVTCQSKNIEHGVAKIIGDSSNLSSDRNQDDCCSFHDEDLLSKKRQSPQSTLSPNKKRGASVRDEQQRPNNFSQIVFQNTSRDELLTKFPLLKSCQECMLELKAGQMLYLPAGWFHEVTSSGSSSTIRNRHIKCNDGGNDGNLDGCHLALNYWYHPPDLLENFNYPYHPLTHSHDLNGLQTT